MSKHSVVEQPDAVAFDSTQTLHALTLRELQDPNQQKWFAIQLAESDRPVNLEAMPRLDVFAAYRLYAVESRQGTTSHYALRLGFFTQEDSAQTICGYVKTFFRSPSVVRVSAAERARFEGPTNPGVSSRKSAAPIAAAQRVARKVAAVPHQSPQLQRPAVSSQKLKMAKSLSQELLEEARRVELSRSGAYRISQPTGSWLSRLLGRSKI